MQGRFELKFVVDAETKQRFLDAVKENLTADPHGQNAVYRVSSLYFDTPDYRAVWEKLDGESVRRKFRLRYYTLDETSMAGGDSKVTADNAFMEIKHRINNTVYTQRANLTAERATSIFTDAGQLGRLADHVHDSAIKQEQFLIDEIQRSATLQKLRAATVITYLREAWLGTVDHRLRVTFDSQCQAYGPHNFAEVQNNTGKDCLDPNLIIMEVKFDRAIPCWIRDVLRDQHLQLQRFSKYASGILNESTNGFSKPDIFHGIEYEPIPGEMQHSNDAATPAPVVNMDHVLPNDSPVQ